MLNALLSQTTASQAVEAHRHAYNAAFEELGLTWHWDAATYARLQAHGRDGVRVYLESEQSHLLRAYEADFLVEAIEATQARCHASRTINQIAPMSSGRSGDSHHGAESRSLPAASRQHTSPAAPVYRAAASALT
ncbi:hypothetical protein [Polaromonas sp.]|uniref:hypothetical protein n=1 Tax=Polaromonas sp. TaxID=1869339 RepID=UPI0035697F9B